MYKSIQYALRYSARMLCSNVTRPSLYNQIKAKINATGPITVADYMKEVLINPACGYYMKKDVFGKEGDFITSPEISQLFGEMIAIWFINEWSNLGKPTPFDFIELGPGRGTMLEDILRVFKKLDAIDDLTIRLVEVSDVLSEIQGIRLCQNGSKLVHDNSHYREGVTKDGLKIYWYKSLRDINTKNFTLVLAHEFFDALPIHKFQKTTDGWKEILIDINSESEAEQKMRYILSNGPTLGTKLFITESEARDHIEVCPEAIIHMEYLGDQFKRYGGIGLIVDYGHCGTKTDTFRAFRNHRQCDPLMEPGCADLTADVDFSSLKKALGSNLVVFGPITQREFLMRMQIAVRLQVLLKICQDDEQKNLIMSGFKMLTDDDQMGSVFKFMCFFPAVLTNHYKKYPVYGFSEHM